MIDSPAIRLLLTVNLAALLFTSGLGLDVGAVLAALRDRRLLVRTALLNFIGVPALTFLAVRLLRVPPEVAGGMMILAAAPFAPVVPIFAGLCRADVALAAAFTGAAALASALFTPLLSTAAMRAMGVHDGGARGAPAYVLLAVPASVILPMLAGLAVAARRPARARSLLPGMRVGSDALGAVSLAVVVALEARQIVGTDWRWLLLMAAMFEVAHAAGSASAGARRPAAARAVLALGAGNRNIAMALPIAAAAASGQGGDAATGVLATVAANGLLMIAMGLIHTGLWRGRLRGTAGSTSERR